MKMEKLNENQLKVDIYKEDLIDRDLKISEIFYGGEKVREFFHELMEIAYVEYDFSVNNIPILVEAMPASKDQISLVVTKISESEDFQSKIEQASAENNIVKDLMGRLANKKDFDLEKNIKNIVKADFINTKENLMIFSFDDIDTVASASKRLDRKFEGKTVLFKNDDKYFLLMEVGKNKKIEKQEEIEVILGEYGNKHISTGESKFYLKEHGEVIIKKDALQVLSKYL